MFELWKPLHQTLYQENYDQGWIKKEFDGKNTLSANSQLQNAMSGTII